MSTHAIVGEERNVSKRMRVGTDTEHQDHEGEGLESEWWDADDRATSTTPAVSKITDARQLRDSKSRRVTGKNDEQSTLEHTVRKGNALAGLLHVR